MAGRSQYRGDMTTLSYDVFGPADAPVVFLGSSLGADRKMWNEVAPGLSDYRVVRFDFPGHGHSHVPDVAGPLTPAKLGEYILEIANELNVERFHIAGLSLGGMMALWMAINHPQRVQSLVMMCSGPVLLPSNAWVERAELVREQGTNALVEATLQRWFTPSFYELNGPGVQRTRQTFLDCADEGYAKCCEVIANMDNRAGLVCLSQPITVVRAEFDATLPEDAALELVASLREGGNQQVNLEYVKGAAHLAAVEQPKQVLQALLAHLRKYA